MQFLPDTTGERRSGSNPEHLGADPELRLANLTQRRVFLSGEYCYFGSELMSILSVRKEKLDLRVK